MIVRLALAAVLVTAAFGIHRQKKVAPPPKVDILQAEVQFAQDATDTLQPYLADQNMAQFEVNEIVKTQEDIANLFKGKPEDYLDREQQIQDDIAALSAKDKFLQGNSII